VPLDLATTGIVAVAAAAVALLAFGLCLAMAMRVRKIAKAYRTLVAGDEDASFVTAVNRQSGAVVELREEVGLLREDLGAARADLADALRHVAVVRYDAFGDMGGRLSFSAALLDDAGDGLVLTSINSRSETRTYAKGVSGGTSDHQLSPEEEEAIAHATSAGRGASSRGSERGADPRRRPART
jgi:Protein of unknown function (DUF4446)